jgi:hypothetical protein
MMVSGIGGGGVRTATAPIMNEKFYESHVFGVAWAVMVAEQPFLARWGCEGGGTAFYASESDPPWHNDFRDPDTDPQSSMIECGGRFIPGTKSTSHERRRQLVPGISPHR